jgi:hypothetical protein
MNVDRERFLALALALSACHRGMSIEDPRCTAVAWVAEAPRCVGDSRGWLAPGYVDAGYCYREAPDGRCLQQEYTPAEYADPIGPDCSGVAWIDEAEKCVAWRSGKLTKHYYPTDECARWDPKGNCSAMVFLPSTK